MQPNKTKLALQIGTVILGAACASNVAADSFNLTVNTIADVALAEVQALSFGTNILTDASAVCAMDALVPAPASVFSDDTTGVVGAGYAVLTGAGCIGSGTTTATPGIYSITGEPTLDVTLTLNSEAQVGNFTFSPTGGCGVVHDDTVGGAGTDPCTAITVATPKTLTLGGPSDLVAALGKTHFTVGGTITTLAGGLNSDTNYNATFLVNVIY